MSRILIVDDDPDILKFCGKVLSARGHEAVVSRDPQEALSTLEKHQVDLIVVDVVMPKVNGFDLLRAMRRNPNLTAPVLILSGRSAISDIQSALSLGATDYMVKPFDQDIFVSKVETILGKRLSAPAVRFAESMPNAVVEIGFTGLLSKITELGMTLKTTSYLDKNVRLKIKTPIFDEIGITCPPLRVVYCNPIDGDRNFQYEVYLTFIGLDEAAMRRIRRWITSRAISVRRN